MVPVNEDMQSVCRPDVPAVYPVAARNERRGATELPGVGSSTALRGVGRGRESAVTARKCERGRV